LYLTDFFDLGEDNRLTEHFIEKAILPGLNEVETSWEKARELAQANKDKEGGKGALVIVGKRDQDKFFSNGPCQVFLVSENKH